ncbi:MAG: SDR family NAD(P)-dependent oxidoreductase [Candidatus Puniceispirillaceae bacterium]
MTEFLKTPSFSLAGKTALVTGGASGIGFGCACALADAGAHAIIAGRTKSALDDAVASLEKEGLSASALVMDVSDIAGTKALIDSHDPFDIILNCAGVARHKPALESIEDEVSLVVNTNLVGAYFLFVHAAQKLIAAGKPASFITMSSQMGHVGGIDRSVYCATKHGVEGFTKALAIEWGPHKIRVNSIAPTFVRTALTAPTFARPERYQWIIEKIKLGEVAEIEDIMGGAVYLASDASRMITGTSLLIDGGWTAD